MFLMIFDVVVVRRTKVLSYVGVGKSTNQGRVEGSVRLLLTKNSSCFVVAPAMDILSSMIGSHDLGRQLTLSGPVNQCEGTDAEIIHKFIGRSNSKYP